jgi:cellulose synthase/poly-beta-1,6-N-acetylglucosamine synthase-like glycosyltransferase
LPPVASPVSDKVIALGRLAVSFTILAWVCYIVSAILVRLLNREFRGHSAMAGETLVYVAITSSLAFSCLMYLVARQGALYRTRAHRRVPRAVIDESFDADLPSMTVLIPSYREEVATVRMTLLSALLQEYPAMRVVLLLDDPPHPSAPEHVESLAASRQLAAELTAWLEEPRERFTRRLAEFDARAAEPRDPHELDLLAAEFAWAAGWLLRRAAEEVVTDHVDRFFVEQILGALADDFSAVGQALATALDEGGEVPQERVRQLYRRLAWTFQGEVTWFERKVFASLSHEANKAMNLNSYIGLMGNTLEVRETPQGRVLAPSQSPDAIEIPDAEFLLTLDADSIVLPEYCLRLVHVMMRPENARLAVVQTPYSAFPGSSTRLERIAGATTDIQHIVHQGMSYYGSTFWVGANAVIRKRALDDIVEVEHHAGVEIRRYVMDRTVIEDTESSLDLATHGWQLLNYPERLSYSATPPDFGSLSIQRRRWANGGLLILPKLWGVRQSRMLRGEHGSNITTLFRVNYLASTCWSSVALLFLLYFPFASRLLSPMVLIVALPYFLAMSSDLRRCGYRRSDMLRIYGLNLILLPVNLAGVLKSVQQGITGRRIPFARTPKVANRTATPLLFALSPLLIIGYSILTAYRGIDQGYWVNAAFALFNTLTASYALFALMGLRHALVDIGLGIWEHLHAPDGPRRPLPTRRRARVAQEPVTPQWDEVLYRGAAATETGQHPGDGTGAFRILAASASPTSTDRARTPDA